MEDDDSIWILFDSLLQDEDQKKIMKLIIRDNDNEEIIRKILNIDKG
jgi:hypothetical protein